MLRYHFIKNQVPVLCVTFFAYNAGQIPSKNMPQTKTIWRSATDFRNIDIAVFDLKNENFFRLMSDIYNFLGQEVDLCQIERIDEYLRKKI